MRQMKLMTMNRVVLLFVQLQYDGHTVVRTVRQFPRYLFCWMCSNNVGTAEEIVVPPVQSRGSVHCETQLNPFIIIIDASTVVDDM